jgi:hypothetical protein
MELTWQFYATSASQRDFNGYINRAILFCSGQALRENNQRKIFFRY